jgi:hypothetical protein
VSRLSGHRGSRRRLSRPILLWSATLTPP